MDVASQDPLPPSAEATRTCWLWRERWLRARFRPGAEVDLADARENVAVARRLSAGDRLPILVDLRDIRSQTAEARAHFSGPEGVAVGGAVALVVASPLSRAIGNFYLGFNRPTVPTRIFSDVSLAETWLATHLAPNG